MRHIQQKINKRNIFLIDGTGAVISSIFLAVILPLLQTYIGTSFNILFLLVGIAVTFSAYSLSSYKYSNYLNKNRLKIIIFGNLSYVILASYLIFIMTTHTTFFGRLYFVLEILIIIFLVIIEIHTLRNKF